MSTRLQPESLKSGAEYRWTHRFLEPLPRRLDDRERGRRGSQVAVVVFIVAAVLVTLARRAQP